MKFTEYEKMADSLEHFEPSKEFENVHWAVTEKIHGANFSFHTDGQTVKVGRRRDFLRDENESFFNYQKAPFMITCPEKVKALFPKIQEIVGMTLSQITLYGELYGGQYNHPDVEKKETGKRMKPVQMEIQYSPNIEFAGFDISYRTTDDPCDEDDDMPSHRYLDFEMTLRLLDQLEIPHLKPLLIGKVNEAMHYELGFDSYVPEQLGLPSLPLGTNKAEGVVIRPMKELICRTTKRANGRAMVKLKIPMFDDRRDQKGRIVHDKSNKQKDGQGKRNKSKAVGRPDKVLLQRLIGLVTENRLISAISKTGQPETEEIEKAVEDEMFHDILADAFDELPESEHMWNGLDLKRRDTLTNSIRAKIRAQINRHKQSQVAEERDVLFAS